MRHSSRRPHSHAFPALALGIALALCSFVSTASATDVTWGFSGNLNGSSPDATTVRVKTYSPVFDVWDIWPDTHCTIQL